MRWLVLLLAGTAWGADPASVLRDRCLKCHGGEKVSAGFDLTKAASPRVMARIESGEMPLGGPRLSPEEVAAVKAWVEGGAKPLAAAPRKMFWAFRPVAKPPVPAGTGARTPIDAFLLEKLQAKGLGFAPRADERTLLRRLAFDLTGLPPGETQPYERAPYEKVIDAYLASPRYGERWGRHWLDVVRFGETDGGEHNFERALAWPYRDYVIESLNADKPYPRFLREQIAGDLLAPQDPKMVRATGFPTAGPWDSVSAELNKDVAMKATARMDELDDMVTTTMHTFQAMTANCARCHDHKFDPIPTRDYYKLTGVFQTVGFGTREVVTPEAKAAYEKAVAPLRAQLKTVEQQIADAEDPVRAAYLRKAIREFDAARQGQTRRIPLNPVFNVNRVREPGQLRLVITGHDGPLAKLDWLTVGGRRIEKWQAERKATPDEPVYLPLGEVAAPGEIAWACDEQMARRPGGITVYRVEARRGDQWVEVASSLDHIRSVEVSLPAAPDPGLVPELKRERDRLKAEIAKLPAPEKLYAAMPHKPEQAYVLERGSITRKGAAVDPGALSVLPAAFATDKDRRLALADWMTDPANPLTARVIVNRVWYFHFGNGIVNTPSDFGLMGDRPSHPELLDWLAASFVENGWSLKWLHRQILLTEAYQQSAAHNAKAFAIDAGNRLLWHMPLKRMDAETLRDSMLAAAGTLDLTMGGPSFRLHRMQSGGSYIFKAVDNPGPETWRRSVYRFNVRGGDRLMMDNFDCPDPSVATPQRSSSNTALQALTLLNDDFVWEQAQKLAPRAGSVGRAYEIVLGRPATERELALGGRYAAEHSLALFCRVLLNTNEFLYIP